MEAATTIGILLSGFAFAISLAGFVDGRKKDQRDLFINVHQVMISKEISRGRRVLLTASEAAEAGDHRAWRGMTDDERDEAGRALAFFDLLGMYVDSGYVNRRETVKVWGPTIVRTIEAGRPYLDERRIKQPYLWPFLDSLEQRSRAAARPS
jgi:hypothetical protein